MTNNSFGSGEKKKNTIFRSRLFFFSSVFFCVVDFPSLLLVFPIAMCFSFFNGRQKSNRVKGEGVGVAKISLTKPLVVWWCFGGKSLLCLFRSPARAIAGKNYYVCGSQSLIKQLAVGAKGWFGKTWVYLTIHFKNEKFSKNDSNFFFSTFFPSRLTRNGKEFFVFLVAFFSWIYSQIDLTRFFIISYTKEDEKIKKFCNNSNGRVCENSKWKHQQRSFFPLIFFSSRETSERKKKFHQSVPRARKEKEEEK